jgi:probable rRNA maturation factor
MQVSIAFESSALNLNEKSIQLIVEESLRYEQVTCDEINLYFVDTAAITSLHEEHFDDPTTTDCITFPLDPPFSPAPFPKVLGDVFVCVNTAIDYAKENDLCAYEELSLYIIHGLLHLIGFDDIEEEDRLIMRQKEQEHLTHLKAKKLLLTSKQMNLNNSNSEAF